MPGRKKYSEKAEYAVKKAIASIAKQKEKNIIPQGDFESRARTMCPLCGHETDIFANTSGEARGVSIPSLEDGPYDAGAVLQTYGGKRIESGVAIPNMFRERVEDADLSLNLLCLLKLREAIDRVIFRLKIMGVPVDDPVKMTEQLSESMLLSDIEKRMPREIAH